jgi:hypothetical protein
LASPDREHRVDLVRQPRREIARPARAAWTTRYSVFPAGQAVIGRLGCERQRTVDPGPMNRGGVRAAVGPPRLPVA